MSKTPSKAQQPNLFSFFKKPATNTPVSTVESKPAAEKSITDEKQVISHTENAQRSVTPSKPLPIQKDSEKGSAKKTKTTLVGKRIEVFWPKDNEWYSGKVVDENLNDQSHTILYDDGVTEILNLDGEQYNICDEKQTKKRKLVVSSDDEHNDETPKVLKQSKKAPGSDDGEWDDSASSYSAEDSQESSDSDDENGWISDSSENSKNNRKSNKKRIGNKIKNNKNTKPPLPAAPQRQNVLVTPASKSSRPNSTNSKDSNGSPKIAVTPDHLTWSGGKNSQRSDSPGPSTPMSDASQNSQDPNTMPEGVYGYGNHEHNEWSFFNSLKDKNGHLSDHSDYDPKTWMVPAAVLKAQTPGMRQWFDFKCENYDTVLFFKVGKFYELFHMDADVGFKELELIFMKGAKAHSGFPEVSYGKYASLLVAKGYKVARIEQTETPDMLKERNKSAGKGNASKVVARELCSVMSMGTRTFCHLDDVSIMAEISGEKDWSQPSSVLLCIKEILVESDHDGIVEYGICYVDTVLGTLTLSQFQDDGQRSRLRTMLSSIMPNEVIVEKNGLHKNAEGSSCNGYSQETLGAIKLVAPKAVIGFLKSGSELPLTPIETIKLVKNGKYFSEEQTLWPVILNAIIEGLSDNSSALVMLALGGAILYLKRSLIDHEVISLGKFLAYVPQDRTLPAILSGSNSSDQDITDSESDQMDIVDETNVGDTRHMIIDAIALSNLEILINNFDKTEKGSLWSFINRCKTPFGKRLLKSWLMKPLFKPEEIKIRSNAIAELMEVLPAQAEEARKILKNIPDLERLLSRVHTNGSKVRATNHPDSRAQMYEDGIYNGRKIRDFIDLLRGFENLLKLDNIFGEAQVNSPLLRKVTRPVHLEENNRMLSGKYPFHEMKSILQHFREIFDEAQAKRDGTIKPHKGLNQDYDQAVKDVKEIEKSFEEYLREQKKITGISELNYWGSGKDRYQIEVPMSMSSKVPSKWVTKSQKKTHRRYWTAAIEEKLDMLNEAEDRVALAEKDTMRSVFERFDKERSVWSAAVTCTSILDALLSLALVSSTPGYSWPEILRKSLDQPPLLSIRNGRHAMIEQAMMERGSGDYIPNDLRLGSIISNADYTPQSQSEYDTISPKMLLLSGPNMGGKSTLLRQTCIICILAQLGCRVPAESCVMTPVDRIFTRVGASDRILSGQSTFFVELAETALILKCATEDSLCILDELGRGTSTFDGTAIAHAVVDHLVGRIKCRSLFATHYHSLVDDWAVDPRVKLGHMDCLVQQSALSTTLADSEKDASEKVTFLYHLCDGSSPKSYGVNVARLAGLPEEVLILAARQSNAFLNKTAVSNTTSRDSLLMSRYFDALVSVVNADISIQELSVIAKELWRRYRHDSSL